ncbi:hypothetical protein BHE74_00040638 [Ensete ventricosum]|nr:hypothetical protein GW17_00034963 [Ensete ventricosum]RWW52904.1 hypothetical protein BHE74_00040638 [Ensete ventricosum]RZS24567.1 hypothetical protein BHM03_00057646 [Ensete ventricosum]
MLVKDHPPIGSRAAGHVDEAGRPPRGRRADLPPPSGGLGGGGCQYVSSADSKRSFLFSRDRDPPRGRVSAPLGWATHRPTDVSNGWARGCQSSAGPTGFRLTRTNGRARKGPPIRPLSSPRCPCRVAVSRRGKSAQDNSEPLAPYDSPPWWAASR